MFSAIFIFSLITCSSQLPVVLNEEGSCFLKNMEEHFIYYYLLPITAFFMTKKVKVIWTPWSDVYSYILETWNIWWRKGHSCTKQRGTELIDLTLCCSQGKASRPANVVFHNTTAMPHTLKLQASVYLSSSVFLYVCLELLIFAYS